MDCIDKMVLEKSIKSHKNHQVEEDEIKTIEEDKQRTTMVNKAEVEAHAKELNKRD